MSKARESSAWMFQVVMTRFYFFFSECVQLVKYPVNDLAGVHRHLSWTLWLVCQAMTPLASLSLMGTVFFTQLGEVAGPTRVFQGCQYNKGNL